MNETNQQIQSGENFLNLSNYDERKKNGDIFWTKEEGQILLNVKQYSIMSADPKDFKVVKVPFSSIQLAKLVNGKEQDILNINAQILDLQQQAINTRTEIDTLFSQLKKDVEEQELS